MQLTGAVAVVTGAGGGIGAATTCALRTRGAVVVAVGNVAAEVEAVAASTGADPLVLDVRDPDHAVTAVEHALNRHGRLDAVVANAGIGHAGAFTAMTPEKIDDLLATNTRAPLLLAHAALPPMLAAGHGSLVFVTSVAGVLLVPRESVYSASKAAVEAFAVPLREELRGSGVTVSTVLPGVVDTDFFTRRGERYDRRFPRPQPPERVATAIVAAMEHGREQVVVPGWFRIPLRIRGAAPATYRALSRRFG